MASPGTSIAWEVVSESAGDKVASVPAKMSGIIAALNLAFERRKAFWVHVGQTRSRACQFVLTGADDWYLEVTASGGRAVLGSHPRPDLTWTSDAAALISVFEGKTPTPPNRVRVEGDFTILKEIIHSLL